jgi:hypothetical protein
VPVVDAVLVLATQPRHALHQLLPVPHFNLRHADPRFDFLATQPRRYRVGIVLDPDRAHAADAHADTLQGLQAGCRQPAHAGQLGGQLAGSTGVARRGQGTKPLFVRLRPGEVAAATQQQGLRHGLLEVPVGRFDVAIFMAAVRVGGLGGDAIVSQQRLVIGGELRRLTVVMHGQGGPVRAMTLGRGVQDPQGVLQPRAQTGEAFRRAHRYVLPVRIGQHEVVQQMVERDAGKGHAQVIHRRKIGRRQPARRVLLSKEDFLVRAVLGFPLADPPFQSPADRGWVLPRMGLLQPLPNRFRQ